MRVIISVAFCFLFNAYLFGQSREIDSLKDIIKKGKGDRINQMAMLRSLVDSYMYLNEFDSAVLYNRMAVYYLPQESNIATADTSAVLMMYNLGAIYQFINSDSAIILSTRALELAQHIGFKRGEANACRALGENYRLRGDYLKALELLFRGLSISREIKDKETESDCLDFMGIAYLGLGEYRVGLYLVFQGMAINQNFPFKPMYPFLLSNIGFAYEKLNMLDSARYFQEKARYIADTMKQKMSPLYSGILVDLGMIHTRLGNTELAKGYYREAIDIKDHLNLGPAQYELANLCYKLGQLDSSLYYARLGFVNCKNALEDAWVVNASRLLTKIFVDRKMIDSAFHYKSIVLSITDSLYSPQKFNSLQLLVIREQQKQNELILLQRDYEQKSEKEANASRAYALSAALIVILIIAAIQFRNNRQKQKANALLNQQKDEIAQAMTELKSTQAQLVQSEKMASLGELTAGIAHEIQNPLNFVNNFSDVNTELIEELKSANKNGNAKGVDELADQIGENNVKVIHHGRRADSIVKGMLQHSRSGAGQKEPTDINALCDEYLRLAFHGMRARDKTFNAHTKTDFGASIGKINIIPQDIGRVLLNLLNNAFFAVHERKKRNELGYEPIIEVITHKETNWIKIEVKDNGMGISEKIMDKIFQPFFTTKPTGQGTGLGLSLSYDIVKAMGGEIRVESKIGEGTVFAILLPATV